MPEKASTVELYEVNMVPNNHIELSLESQNVMSIPLPKIEVLGVNQIGHQSYSDITSPLETEKVKSEMLHLLPSLIALAEKRTTNLLTNGRNYQNEKTR